MKCEKESVIENFLQIMHHNCSKTNRLTGFFERLPSPISEKTKKNECAPIRLKIGPPAVYFWIPVYMTSDLLYICFGRKSTSRFTAMTHRSGREEKLGYICDLKWGYSQKTIKLWELNLDGVRGWGWKQSAEEKGKIMSCALGKSNKMFTAWYESLHLSAPPKIWTSLPWHESIM